METPPGAADLNTPLSALCWQAVRQRAATSAVIGIALAMSVGLPSAAQEQGRKPSLAVLDFAVSDHSPLPDPGAGYGPTRRSRVPRARACGPALAPRTAGRRSSPARFRLPPR